MDFPAGVALILYLHPSTPLNMSSKFSMLIKLKYICSFCEIEPYAHAQTIMMIICPLEPRVLDLQKCIFRIMAS